VGEGAKVIAVERDPEMLEVLRGELGTHPRIELCFGDAMQIDYAQLAARAGGQVAVAGNLPYQLASRLIFAALEARAHISHCTFMVQKEMADRILAAPDTDHYGALGVMVQTYADVRRVVAAPAHAFMPAPKVDSSVVTITPLEGQATRVPIVDEALYSKVVHAAFGQRRKTLRNALRGVFSDERALAACTTAGIDAGRRGETLAIAEYARLTAALAG
jgi:16S rRNA (adenine1518-N6/adenine1519-N6)-dimethyltransferase